MAKKNNTAKVLGGAFAGAVLGAVAGMLLAPQSGKKTQKDLKNMAADFYKSVSPKLKKAAKMGEAEYKQYMKKAVESYAKARKLSAREAKDLMKQAQGSWNYLKKHLL